MGEARVLLVAAIALGVGLAAGWLLARFWRPGAAWGLVALLAVAVVALILAGRQAQGFEGLGYAIAAVVMLTPAALGAALGGWLSGWLGGRR